MRQFTTPEQTAKLIELGFEKPKSISSIKVTGDIITTAEDLIGEPPSVMGGKITANYSIGELISFLPKSIKVNDFYFTLTISAEFDNWVVEYVDIAYGSQADVRDVELIDALFTEIVILKEDKIL